VGAESSRRVACAACAGEGKSTIMSLVLVSRGAMGLPPARPDDHEALTLVYPPAPLLCHSGSTTLSPAR
jgi:hypothetical protein